MATIDAPSQPRSDSPTVLPPRAKLQVGRAKLPAILHYGNLDQTIYSIPFRPMIIYHSRSMVTTALSAALIQRCSTQMHAQTSVCVLNLIRFPNAMNRGFKPLRIV